ncbi:MAG TPA: ABC transporter permease [Chitinophagaceae bacterium]|nr:ABC transporter permease [Chitinophagaceae bacterium]MCB9055999.1 ABC transporter permease [Chitinophagales bacterium]HPG10168.1 ABC transporter permease [Chitinophagaceae bacterium]
MKVAGFIANRIAFNRSTAKGDNKRSFSGFIIRLATIATAVSVMVMVVTLAFANGFQQTVSQKIFSFWGHIRIQEKQPDKSIISEETPIIQDPALANAIRQNPEVKSIHSFATKYAILKTTDEIEGVLVKGFDSTFSTEHFQSFILDGRFIQFNDSTYSREIMLSEFTAKRLQLKTGDRILIYFIRPDESIRPDKLTVSGIYKTGIEEYDKTFAIGDIKLIQRLNEWMPDEIGGYEVFLNDYKKIDPVADEIYNMHDFPLVWDAVSVKRISPNIFDWLNMQDKTRNLLIIFMLVVAVINLISCLLILVLERVRMIGILKSIGATNWTVQKIFLYHSFLITVRGVLLGLILGLGLLFLQKATGFIRLQEEAYYVSTAAVKIVWWQVLVVCLVTLIISFLVMLIPSLLARKIQPVKAVQFR